MKKESKLWQRLKQNFKHLNLQRVESSITPGMPDIYFTHSSGANGWIELKHVDVIKQKVKFQPSQPNWIRKHVEDNGFVICIVQVGEESIHVCQGKHIEGLIYGKNLYNSTCFIDRQYSYMCWNDFEWHIIREAMRHNFSVSQIMAERVLFDEKYSKENGLSLVKNAQKFCNE